MNFFWRRTIECKLCKKKTKRKGSFDFVMNTAEGKHKIKICSGCATFIEELMKHEGI